MAFKKRPHRILCFPLVTALDGPRFGRAGFFGYNSSMRQTVRVERWREDFTPKRIPWSFL